MRHAMRSLLGLSPRELTPQSRLRPGRDVLSVEHEGATVLLDLRREIYFGIDEVGTTIWQLLERGATCAEIELELEAQYDADPEELRRDARAFVDELVRRRLAVPSDGSGERAVHAVPAASRARRRARTKQSTAPGVVQCFLTVLLLSVHMRVFGIRRGFRLAERLAGPVGGRMDEDAAATLARRVALVSAFYPHRALCMEQSLALYVLLRRRDIDAVFRLGIRARPFAAHMWVLVAGRPINERPELTLQFATFAEIGG